MRKKVIVGNWKMNNTLQDTKKFIEELDKIQLDPEVEAGICPPFTSLCYMSSKYSESNIKFGAQNMYDQKSGAYTGEVSVEMLIDLKCDYVILGHSERREYFHESDEFINKKIKLALEYGLTPILCVGENLEQREEEKHFEVVKDMVIADFKDIDAKDADKIIIAYEPIWAIGTGKTATSEQAQEMCAYIRQVVDKLYGSDVSGKIRIQYGGSVKPENVKELMEKEDIDGALVGGASLNAESFGKLINYKGVK